jgi:hypothetical protein
MRQMIKGRGNRDEYSDNNDYGKLQIKKIKNSSKAVGEIGYEMRIAIDRVRFVILGL